MVRFFKVSGDARMKVLVGALFSSSLIDQKNQHVIILNDENNCYLHYKEIALLYRKTKFLTSFNSSRHSHILYITSTW